MRFVRSVRAGDRGEVENFAPGADATTVSRIKNGILCAKNRNRFDGFRVQGDEELLYELDYFSEIPCFSHTTAETDDRFRSPFFVHDPRRLNSELFRLEHSVYLYTQYANAIESQRESITEPDDDDGVRVYLLGMYFRV